jgi:hypothetical protein
MKPKISRHSLAVLSGAMFFASEAGGVEVLTNGSFEVGGASGWPSGFATYNQSDDYYSGPALNSNDDPAAGAKYSWNNLGSQVVEDLLTAASISATSVDSGGAEYSLSAWLSGYPVNPEFSGIELKFFDTVTTGGTQVDDSVTFDGDDEGGLYNAGWSGIGARPAPDQDRNTWTFFRFTGEVPIGARRAEVRIFNSGGLSGAPDTYVDVVSLDITDNYLTGQPSNFSAILAEVTGEVSLSWQKPEDAFDAPTVEVLRDGIVLATLSSSVESFVDMPPLSETAPQSFNYQLRFVEGGGGQAIVLARSIDWVPDNLVGGLVAYYRFEEGYRDTSGSAASHDGVSAGGARTIGGGIYGHCLELRDQSSPRDALVLGDHPDFDFGSATDFSVSLWFRRLGPMENNNDLGGSPTDATLISDKNWVSGGNTGWGIFTTSDGGVKWNFSDGSTRLDHTINAGFGSSGVADGQWHHLVVTHDREGMARFYIDGEAKGGKLISGLGSVATGLPLVLGSDGNVNYPWGGSLDEVAIWRRALFDEEVSKVYQARVTGESVTGRSIVDSDRDGMDDAWEISIFGDLSKTSDGDDDGDGASNFEEYALGTSPMAASPSGFKVTSMMVGEERYPVVSYTRPALAGDVGYQVEVSDDLVMWEHGEELFIPVGSPQDLGDGLSYHQMRFHQPLVANNKRYFRVRMESRYQGQLSTTVEPTLEFRGGSAVIRWETEEPTATILDFGRDGKASGRFENYGMRTQHEVVIPSVDPGEVLAYTVLVVDAGSEARSKTLTTSRAWDYSAPGVPDQGGYVTGGDWATRAAGVLSLPEVDGRGYALDLRCGGGQLAYELVRQSSLVVVAVEDTQAEVEVAKAFLAERGVYGARVSVVLAEDLDDLPFAEGIFNLVVSGAQVAGESNVAGLLNNAEELVVPGRGVVAAWNGTAWTATVRGETPGADDWTMQYGGPGNRGANEEELGGKKKIPDFELNWIGRPGPEIVIDRMVRAPSPLSAGGRFYCQGMGRILALDAHNGSVLWNQEIREVRRLNMIRDASNMTASDEGLYLAVRGQCWKLAAEDGARTSYQVVPGPREDLEYDWGYVSRTEDQLLGSATKSDAFYRQYWGQDFWFDAQSGSQTYQVCSDNLFSMDPETGMTNWTYQRGLILNISITIGDGKIFFLETTDSGVIVGDSRRLSAANWKKNLKLVCLNQATGALEWEVEPNLTGGEPCLWVQYAEGRLLITGSEQSNDSFNLYGFNPSDGSLDWTQSHGWRSSHHGGNHQHPVITGGSIYLEPHRYCLATGVRTGANVMPGRNGCSTFRGAKDVLFYRGVPMSGQYAGNIAMWDPVARSSTAISRVRPGCWLSWVPASGAILVQEQGAGCSCGSWMETSFGLAPKK